MKYLKVVVLTVILAVGISTPIGTTTNADPGGIELSPYNIQTEEI